MKPKIIMLATVLILAGLCFCFLRWFDIGEVFTLLKSMGLWGFGLYGFCVAGSCVFGAFSWQNILRSRGHNIPYRDLFIGRLIGFTVSLLTPSAYVGGEPVRAYYISRKHKLSMTEVLTSAMLDKILELTAFTLLVYASAFGCLLSPNFGNDVKTTLIAFILASTFILGLLFWSMFSGKKSVAAMTRVLARPGFFRKKLLALADWISEIEAVLHQMLTKGWRHTGAAFLFNLILAFLIFIKPIFFFWMVSGPENFPFANLCALYSLTQLLLCLPLTPGAAGVYEGGIFGITSMLGVDRNCAAAFILLARFWDAALVFAGICVMAKLGMGYFLRHLYGESSPSRMENNGEKKE